MNDPFAATIVSYGECLYGKNVGGVGWFGARHSASVIMCSMWGPCIECGDRSDGGYMRCDHCSTIKYGTRGHYE